MDCPPYTYILQYLNNLEKHGFLRAIPVRTEHAGKKLPASHSKVFYEVAISNPNSNDAFIRLDVLYEDNPYTHTIAVPIDLPFLKQEGTPLMVNVPTKEEFTRLQGGIRRLESYMYQQSYYIENATDDSAKAAYLTTCFERGVTKIEKFSPKVDVMDIPINNLPRKIQKLRKSRPEAFYYWSKVAEMTELK